MRDDEEGESAGDTVALGDVVAPQMEHVLQAVRAERRRQDERQGYFRDYPDSTEGPSGVPSWLAQADERRAATLRATDAKDVAALYRSLIREAEVTVAWLEALERRMSGKVVSPSMPPWWKRFFQWFRPGPS